MKIVTFLNFSHVERLPMRVPGRLQRRQLRGAWVLLLGGLPRGQHLQHPPRRPRMREQRHLQRGEQHAGVSGPPAGTARAGRLLRGDIPHADRRHPPPGRVGNKKPTKKNPLKMFFVFVFCFLFNFLIFYEHNTKFSLWNRFFMNKEDINYHLFTKKKLR